MKKRTVMTIVGTRPELIKLSRIIPALDRHFLHVLVHTGQNHDYELNGIFFDQMGIRKPDHFLDAARPTAAESIAEIILRSDTVFEKEKPDALLIYGDTNSCLSVIPAKRRHIPIFHLEAGNRCFDERVPEEVNRRIIDHVSDINMPLTEHGRRYLLAEGIRPETIFTVGSCMREVIEHHRKGIERSAILKELKLAAGKYVVASFHREENVDDAANLSAILDSLDAVKKEFGKRIIVSTHPRTRKRLAGLKHKASKDILFLKPLGFLDYIRLQKDAFCVLSDSGTLTEEAAILGFPAVMIRNAHERPEGMDAGVAIMSGLKSERVIAAVDMATRIPCHAAMVADYERTQVSVVVARIIASYIDYVNRTVWSKR
ncbi:MAG TPA: UDP-N-acetylglucosamine 2-epimerase (non-hydrolyzing) [bacterium]|nr:UDP-N-acetylglucosamine 2-epimerase (non-hydrolyzing) [bacterium]